MPSKPDLDAAYSLETPEDNRRLYRDWAETYDQDFVEATGYRFPAVVVATYLAAGGGWPCLDVGCGTGALAERMPQDAVVDGIDISPEMLAVARRKGLYRALIEANLKKPLDLPDAAYRGLVSSGTFTHGHVGPEALPELVRLLGPGAIAVITVRPQVWSDLGFEESFEALAGDGLTTPPEIAVERVYDADARPPEGHEEDTGFVATFRRL